VPFRLLVLTLVVALSLCGVSGPVSGRESIVVPAGGDLQAAINRARQGDVILLEPGAIYVGNFTLPQKQGSAYITIRSSADPSRFPAEGRVTPDHRRWMPTLRSPNASAALATTPGAHHWRLQWLAFEANANGANDIITLGDGSEAQRTPATIPRHFILDGLIIRGNPERGQKRAIALNSGATVIRNSDIRDIKAEGQDSQAICGWNGPGPYTIENNYLEAAGENVMFGGADPSVPNLVPSDITLRRNYVTKSLEWRAEGSPWTVKNLLELKNARRVLIEGNIFEHNWSAAQAGYAILFTPKNQDGRAPWSIVSDVTFQFNIVRHVASAINITGYDYEAASRQTRGIVIRQNVLYDVDASRWGGEGRFVLLGDEAADILIDHNTVLQSGSFLQLYGKRDGRPRPIRNLQLSNNLALHNEYGIIGEDYGVGQPAIAAYISGGEVRRNVMAGGDSAQYPPDNFFPNVGELMKEFVDGAGGDYRLQPSSRFRTAGTDGSMLGANVELIQRLVPTEGGGRR
jgi:Right handed beta helix region